jgi:hypothetical protein
MSDSETEDVQYKVTKDFRKNVLKWVELDDNVRILKGKIKEINEKIKEFNENKKIYEEPIIGYLNKPNLISDIKLPTKVLLPILERAVKRY